MTTSLPMHLVYVYCEVAVQLTGSKGMDEVANDNLVPVPKVTVNSSL